MQQLFTFELPALNFLKHQSRLLFNASYTPSPFTEHASQYKTFKLPHFGHRFQMIAHLFHIEKVHNPLCNIILGNNVKQSYTYQSYQIFKSMKWGPLSLTSIHTCRPSSIQFWSQWQLFVRALGCIGSATPKQQHMGPLFCKNLKLSARLFLKHSICNDFVFKGCTWPDCDRPCVKKAKHAESQKPEQDRSVCTEFTSQIESMEVDATWCLGKFLTFQIFDRRRL